MGGRFGEIVLLAILVVLLFGPSKLPDIAKSMGQALNEFKKAANPQPENQNPQPQKPVPSALTPEPEPVVRKPRKPAKKKGSSVIS